MVRREKPKNTTPRNTTKGLLPKADAMEFDRPEFIGAGKKKGAIFEHTEPLTEEQRALIESNPRLLVEIAGWVMNRFKKRFGSDQVRQHGLVEIVAHQTHRHLLLAARAWRPKKGTAFTTYATNLRLSILFKAQVLWMRAVQRAPLDMMISRRYKRGSARRDERSTRDQERSRPTVASVLAGESRVIAEALLSDLWPQEAEVLSLRYGLAGETLSLEETAQKLGTTRSAVRVLEAKALYRLGAFSEAGTPQMRDFTEARAADGHRKKGATCGERDGDE